MNNNETFCAIRWSCSCRSCSKDKPDVCSGCCASIVSIACGLATRHSSDRMVATNAHPPIVDLSNFDKRKQEITQQLMDAATHSGARPAPSGNPFRYHSTACSH